MQSPQPTPPTRTAELSAKILSRFPTAKADYTKPRRLKVTVPAERMKEAALFARDELRFDHIHTVSGTDYMAKGEMEVIYFVGSVQEDQSDLVVALAERVPRGAPSVPSLIEVWPGAEFHERETFEMLGVNFEGHPDLRKILLPEDWNDIPPLRKDFVSRGDDRVTTESEYSPDPDNIMHVALGPQHPGAGHFRIRLWLDGDYVVKADPDPGYVHRGEEKMAEYRNYMQNVPHLERPAILDSCGILFPYAEAVDELMGNKVPPRGQYLRVIMAELNRIISHMYFLSIYGLFEGHTTMITWGMGDRDLFIDLAARIGGARVTFAYIIPGGVRNDMPGDMTEKALKTCDWFEGRIREYEKIWLNNPLFEQRARGIGVLKREDAIRFGATGTVLRASGVKHDIRRAEPYSAYPDFDFDIPVSKEGDCWARGWVAMEEMKQSLRILRQAFTGIPEGPVRLKIPIQPRVPAGESYFRTEAAHGEQSYHLVSDGTPRPYRLKIGDPNFRNMILIRELLKGAHVADIPPIYWGLNYWPVSADR